MPSGGRRSSSPWSGRTNGQKAAAALKKIHFQMRQEKLKASVQQPAKRSWWIDPMTREEFMRCAEEEAAKSLNGGPNYERKDLV